MSKSKIFFFIAAARKKKKKRWNERGLNGPLLHRVQQFVMLQM